MSSSSNQTTEMSGLYGEWKEQETSFAALLLQKEYAKESKGEDPEECCVQSCKKSAHLKRKARNWMTSLCADHETAGNLGDHLEVGNTTLCPEEQMIVFMRLLIFRGRQWSNSNTRGQFLHDLTEIKKFPRTHSQKTATHMTHDLAKCVESKINGYLPSKEYNNNDGMIVDIQSSELWSAVDLKRRCQRLCEAISNNLSKFWSWEEIDDEAAQLHEVTRKEGSSFIHPLVFMKSLHQTLENELTRLKRDDPNFKVTPYLQRIADAPIFKTEAGMACDVSKGVLDVCNALEIEPLSRTVQQVVSWWTEEWRNASQQAEEEAAEESSIQGESPQEGEIEVIEID